MDKILAELAEVFGVKQVSKGVYRIDTTFYLSGGVAFIIYLTVDGRKVTITDEGALLESTYLPTEEDLNTQLIDKIRATINPDGSITKQTTVRKLTKDIFSYIEALMDTSALYGED